PRRRNEARGRSDPGQRDTGPREPALLRPDVEGEGDDVVHQGDHLDATPLAEIEGLDVAPAGGTGVDPGRASLLDQERLHAPRVLLAAADAGGSGERPPRPAAAADQGPRRACHELSALLGDHRGLGLTAAHRTGWSLPLVGDDDVKGA